MSRWPTEKHFTSWLTLAPHNKISGGRLLSSRTQPSANRAAGILRLAAMSLGRTETALGAFYRRAVEVVGEQKGERDLTAALIGAPASRNVAMSLQEEAAMRMGLREANQHFSRAVKAVKAGREVVLTERGKPIAVIRPLRPTDPANAAIARLVGEGRLRLAKVRGPVRRRGWKPIRTKGPPLSQTLSEERDAR